MTWGQVAQEDCLEPLDLRDHVENVIFFNFSFLPEKPKSVYRFNKVISFFFAFLGGMRGPTGLPGMLNTSFSSTLTENELNVIISYCKCNE